MDFLRPSPVPEGWFPTQLLNMGLGFERLPFLPFLFPLLLSEGGKKRPRCGGSITGRAGPHLVIPPLSTLVWQRAGNSLFAIAVDKGRRTCSLTGFAELSFGMKAKLDGENLQRLVCHDACRNHVQQNSLLRCGQVMTPFAFFLLLMH